MSGVEWINVASTVIQAIAIVVTAAFAVAGLKAWRKELIGRRKFEVAEQALSAFAEAKEALAYVRDRLVHKGEGTSRPRNPDETESDEVARARDLEFVPLERLYDVRGEFSALRKAQVACRIHFGDEAEKAIDTLFSACNQVRITAHSLLEMADHEDHTQEQRETRVSFRRVVWSSGSGDDKLAQSVEDGYRKLLQICLPHLD
jgi:hypothetical protein